MSERERVRECVEEKESEKDSARVILNEEKRWGLK